MMESSVEAVDRRQQWIFWGCFIALVTTSFAFFTRMYLCDVRFGTDFGIDKVGIGALKGAGVWPFAISIILFSLVIDRIGYRAAMFFSFICYAVYLVMASMAYAAIQDVPPDGLAAAQAKGYQFLYWGSIVLALGNGTVEAFINPVVATMFSRQKTKWLNILHAGWPGGLVVAGIITIMLAGVAKSGDWRIVLGIIAVPAVIYLVMLAGVRFPPNEREAAGVSYREMLAEFGAFGALVGFGLIFLQLAEVFRFPVWVAAALSAIVAIGFGLATGGLGRPILAFLMIIMMPLATTEIGTDGWISGLMEKPMEEAGFNPGWVLVYTSAIMMVLRFFAGPIVHSLSPIGLLVASSVLAILGLLALSQTGSAGLGVIFVAATLYGIGKTFFWPTMLGVTAEQCPKGGALTLNAISGIGMIAVGVLGFPLIGALQERTATARLEQSAPEVASAVLVEKPYMGMTYGAIDPDKRKAFEGKPEAEEALAKADKAGQFETLAKMAAFPGFMLLCYLGLQFYFTAKGGYRAEHLVAAAADEF
jgi:MFS family permease